MEKKEKITHHWDDEIGDTTCGYLNDGEIISSNLKFVNCEQCLKILNEN